MDDKELRLECVKLAAQTSPGGVVEEAGKLYAFTAGRPTPYFSASSTMRDKPAPPEPTVEDLMRLLEREANLTRSQVHRLLMREPW